MTMKNKLLILFLVFLTIINIAALTTIAYHRFHPQRSFHPGDRPETPGSFIKRELGLNEEQAKEFESQAKRFEEEIKPIRDSLEAKRIDLMNEIMAEKPSPDKLSQLSEEIGALHVKLEKRTSMHLLQGKSLLTPEQQKKFFSLFKEGQNRMRRLRDRGDRMEKGPQSPDFEEGR
jgi:Spy/CpxP family protein refolding chaperone